MQPGLCVPIHWQYSKGSILGTVQEWGGRKIMAGKSLSTHEIPWKNPEKFIGRPWEFRHV